MPQASLLVLRMQSSRSDKRCQGADKDTKTRLYRSVIFLIRLNKLPKAKEALGRECNLHISRNPASLGNHERLWTGLKVDSVIGVRKEAATDERKSSD